MNITLKNLTHKYDEQLVVNNLNLNLENVNSVGIIGASGCGKSTLMRLLSGIETPFNGDIFINNLSPVTDKKQFQKRIGFVFQKHNLFPHLTVFDNLFLILHKIKKIDKKTASDKIYSLLESLKISNEANKKPNEISGGQAQRASIARAICTDPDILFLDEPTAALDPILTREVLNSVKDLKKTGTDFIFITHEMDFLRDFADYVIFMDNGQIIEQGYVDILNSPKTQQLSDFLSH